MAALPQPQLSTPPLSQNLTLPQPQLSTPPLSQNLTLSTPAEAPVLTSAEATVETPAEAPVETPVLTQPQVPVETPAEDPVETPVEAPVETPAEAPVLNQSAAQPQASAPSISASSPKCQPDDLRYKNRLQEYTQRSGIPLPIYQTINEGLTHLPSFRSSVLVDGAVYTSRNTFTVRKAAEQDVARLAMMSIAERIKEEGVPPIHEDTVFCKTILIEYSVKRNIERPSYNTVATNGLLPAFVSSLVFDGVSYTGEVGRNKKEAEQLAARAVIQSLLGHSESGLVMSEIIKSKYKLYASLHKMKDSHGAYATVPPAIVNIWEASCAMLQPHHEFKKRKLEEPAPQATPELPLTFVPSVYEQPPEASLSNPLGIAPASLGVPPASLGVPQASLSVPPVSLGVPSAPLGVPPAVPPAIPPAHLAVPPAPLGVTPASLGIAPPSKKRRRNKKKAKNLQNDAQTPVTTSA